jgi:hypothetical protein
MAVATIASSLIGAASQRSAAKKAANAAKGAQRNYLKEMQTALDAQSQIQPRLLQLEREYRPQWQELEADMLSRQIGLSRLVQEDATRGSGDAAMRMAREMEPVYGYASEAAMDRYREMLGPETAGLYNLLQARALQDLEAGRGLNEEERTQAEQSARAVAQSRGLQFGNQAAILEALSSYELANNREERRRQAALQAYGLGEGMAANAWNRYGMPLMQQAGFASPQMVMGLAQQMQASAGPQVFQPESQYSAGVYGANVQNMVSSQLAAAQAKAGMGAGLMDMTGKIAGAYFGNPGLFAGTPTATGSSVSPITPYTAQNVQNVGAFWNNAGVNSFYSPPPSVSFAPSPYQTIDFSRFGNY